MLAHKGLANLDDVFRVLTMGMSDQLPDNFDLSANCK